MKKKWKKEKRLKSLKGMLLPRIIYGNLIVILVGLSIISVCALSFIRDELGNSRVEMLQQISDLNQLNMNAMDNTMNRLYDNIQEHIYQQNSWQLTGEKADEVMTEATRYFSDMGVNSVVDIILKDGRVFTSDDNMSRVVALKKTAWYTQLISGAQPESWYMNFSDREDSEKGILLSLGKTLFNSEQEPIGIVVISTSQQTLYRSYENALNEDNVIYILDENGTVISHSNPRVIGFSFYYMPTFEKNVAPFNSYTMTTKQGKAVLISNYRNTQNNWTFVEELDFSSKLKDYSRIVLLALLGVAGCFLVMLGLDYLLINKITNSLTGFSREIKSLQLGESAKATEIPVQESYSEIKIITESFNRMLARIQELIQNIKINEQKKRKAEFDFLQAQIEPHFVRNTLLTLKSLIALGEYEKAMSMMDDFNALLKIPMMVEKQFVSVYDEIQLVIHYMAIMEYRFDKKFLLRVDMNEECRHVLIPRMILQPVVANALFHGFAEKEDDGTILVKAGVCENDLLIQISDNGEGMTAEQIKRVMEGKRNPNSHHGVGLQNVINRLKLIYGKNSGLSIRSEKNKGTEVTLRFSDYKSVYCRKEVEGNENPDCG
ncbi:MAG: cache domain-containing sensor histidine kinase [Ruminococcus sp.]|jgi:two-component system sensor histidine kinase YesM